MYLLLTPHCLPRAAGADSGQTMRLAAASAEKTSCAPGCGIETGEWHRHHRARFDINSEKE
jgi:hypothetical protein